ncbi:hypothetical protein L211DRAFT_511802 [Terfezia boudieri ATCC MYA-4762]|uniref:Uncharacterized protein n=1 Tax=Terfezia boudieri ATCC MYA-4762 TaxID=1051890 RepID=A0A3N4LCN7_9PEZI|nr:hypothetical protein L211DRAFT_511802 [Terfezia boudieri ATCC MYA-4762]
MHIVEIAPLRSINHLLLCIFRFSIPLYPNFSRGATACLVGHNYQGNFNPRKQLKRVMGVFPSPLSPSKGGT